MKKLIATLVASLVLAFGSVATPSPASADVYYSFGGCKSTVVYTSLYTRCTYAWNKAMAICKVSGSSQQFLIYGPKVAPGSWSVATCPWPMYVAGGWPIV
jgi:hypothetical protein